jgi:hypothetical protein
MIRKRLHETTDGTLAELEYVFTPAGYNCFTAGRALLNVEKADHNLDCKSQNAMGRRCYAKEVYGNGWEPF